MVDVPNPTLEHLNFEFKSGETLALELGVSRTAVWKAVGALEAQGFPVESARAGYRLRPGTPAAHLLGPRLSGRWGFEYTYLGRVGSTQDALREQAQLGALEGAVVLAETQSSGRGRRGRGWQSPAGSGLYFSLLLKPDLPLERVPLLSLAAGVALHEACGVGGLKWPNDLLSPDGRKLAGILLEGDLRGEELRHVLLGIGLNVHSSGPSENTITSASLEEFRSVSRLDLLVEILSALERWVYASPQNIVSAWKSSSYTLGQRVKTPSGDIGTALDLDISGALLVEVSGQPERITAGDVELLGLLETK